MTSSYSKKIAKLKNALENVFVKKTDIKDNLTSTDTNKPLSANQGKILDTNKVDKISGKSLSTNDFTNTYKTKLDNLDTILESKASNTHTHGNLQNDGSIGTSNNVNKNVITDGNGKITTEDKPTIPSASSTVPSADTSSGSYGSGTTYARANHQHPKSSLYAETSHTHTKSEITNFTHTHSISDVATLQTTLNGKADKSHTHNEYVTNQELYDNIPIDYVITATDSTFTESVSPFIVGEDYYFTISAVQASYTGVTVMPITDIRCEIVHSGAVADLTPVESDANTVTFKFTPTEQKGHILKVYFLGIPVATYTFDAIIDTGWQEVTFKSGYTRYSNSTSVYIRRKGDFVELTGVWKPTKTQSAASTPVAFASIPDELKPTKAINTVCSGQGKNTYMLTVRTDAWVCWSRYGTTTSIDLPNGHFGSVHCMWTI